MAPPEASLDPGLEALRPYAWTSPDEPAAITNADPLQRCKHYKDLLQEASLHSENLVERNKKLLEKIETLEEDNRSYKEAVHIDPERIQNLMTENHELKLENKNSKEETKNLKEEKKTQNESLVDKNHKIRSLIKENVALMDLGTVLGDNCENLQTEALEMKKEARSRIASLESSLSGAKDLIAQLMARCSKPTQKAFYEYTRKTLEATPELGQSLVVSVQKELAETESSLVADLRKNAESDTAPRDLDTAQPAEAIREIAARYRRLMKGATSEPSSSPASAASSSSPKPDVGHDRPCVP